jgi:hypothetical protein
MEASAATAAPKSQQMQQSMRRDSEGSGHELFFMTLNE